MGKRIRHLEYYGYADQNTYMGIPNVDLSDIREVNKEQDKEINAISGATKDKADISTVNEISGKVDTFIDKQSTINKCLAKAIKKNKKRIDNLEARDTEIVDKINEVADKIDPIYVDIDSISGKVDSIDDRLTEHLSETSEFEEETNRRLVSLETNITSKLDKAEADETYAKKSSVYTKEEVDEKISHSGEGAATQQWVLEQGFITEDAANDKYATKQKVNALEDRVTDIQTTLYTQYSELSSDLSSFEQSTNNKIGELENKVTTHGVDISNIQNVLTDIDENVQAINDSIEQINNVALPSKADKSDLNTLTQEISGISSQLDDKLDKADYESDKARLGVKIEFLENKKADKSELAAISGSIGSVDDKIEQEKQARISADNALGNRIDDTNSSVADIREENLTRDRKIANLERDLTKEINDRVGADNAIIGTASDVESDTTIYGAKKYADKVANNALLAAKAYIDAKDGATRDYVDEAKADVERQLTAKADKAYVNAVKAEIETSIDAKVSVEKTRAEEVENDLGNAIGQEIVRATNKERTISSALTHTSNIVHALTDWNGDDRIDYTDEGNGIIDVMHREIHKINQKIGNMSYGIVTKNEYEFGIGTYNVSHSGFDDSEKTIFSVGIGTSDVDRKNALEVRKDGSVYILVNDEYIKLNNTLIESVWYEDGIIHIKFSNGDVIDVNLGELIDENEFKDGLQVVDGIVSVLIDETSEDYITVSQNGIKVSGIDAKIEEERNRAEAAEEALDSKIDNIKIDCGIY